jgi:mannosylglycerate hydrolase
VGEDGSIALTLLRSVGWLSRDDLWVRRVAAGPIVETPGAQCLGWNTYEYAILPHVGDWRNVYQTAYNYNAPLLARRADTHAGLVLREMNITRDDPARVIQREYPRGGVLPDAHSFISVEPPELVMSAVYRSGYSLIIRVYNVTREPVSGTIRFGFPVARAFRVDMAEVYQATLTVSENCLHIDVRGAEVITLKVMPG